MDRPFVVDAVLTAIAVGYRNPSSSYIADRALPRTQVSGEKFKWSKYATDKAFNTPDPRVGRMGQVPQLEFGGSDETSSVEDFGFDVPIPNSDIDAARAAREAGLSHHDPEGHAVMRVADTLMNCREVRVAGIIHNPATYAAGRKVALAGTSKFSDYEHSDPIGVINTGLDSTLIVRPNVMAMGRGAWTTLRSHPKIVNAVKGNITSSGNVSVEQFKELFAGDGVTDVLIGDAWYNTARPGQAASLARAWGNNIALLHIDPLAVAEQNGGITFGLTAQFGTAVAGRIEDPDIGLQGGFRIRNGERIKELVVAQDAGYLIQGVA